MTISWKKICHENHYDTATGQCNLCLRENLGISRLDPKFSINKKSELFKNCVHKWRFKLAAYNYEKYNDLLKQNMGQFDDFSIVESLEETDSSQSLHLNISSTKSTNNTSDIRNQSTGIYLTRKRARELNAVLNIEEI